MAKLEVFKGYKDYGTFIVYQFSPASGYTPAIGDVVTINNNGLIAKATSDASPIATGVVFDVDQNVTKMAVVLLGQGIIGTDNVATGSGAPAVGDYVEINDGVWEKAGGTNDPSGIVIAISDGLYHIYKFI